MLLSLRTYKHFYYAIAAIIALWLIRCVCTRSITYGFIPFNIILAIIPLLLEVSMRRAAVQLRGHLKQAGLAVLGALWLLFLPNAFYILTDFMHLNSMVLVNKRDDNYRYATHYVRGDSLFVFDSLLIFAATVLGAYAGGLALLHAYRFFVKRFTARRARVLLAIVIGLSSIGVYLGRFSRWNSWEGFIHPINIIADVIHDATDPARRGRFLAIIVTFLIFHVACLYYVWHSQSRAAQ